LFNVIDATSPFELIVGAPGTVGASPMNPTGTSGAFHGAACPKASGSLSGRTLGPLKLGLLRTRAHGVMTRFSTRGQRYMDFFCLTPIGIRAGYPSATLLDRLSAKERRRVRARIVLLLTANRRYALHGMRPGARLARVARRLNVRRGVKIGLNTWYVAPGAASHGLLKVRRGIIEEVGIADKRLTSGNRAALVRFLKMFRSP
jgi:hypothetical protein